MKITKKEKFYYTCMVCFAMEFIMAYYNYFFHTDAFLDEAFVLACMEFIPAYLVGVVCEYYLISNVAKKIAKFLHAKHLSDYSILHINEVMVALGMMVVISTYGTFLHANGHNVLILFMQNFAKNAFVGIPLFIFVVSPLSRSIIQRSRK